MDEFTAPPASTRFSSLAMIAGIGIGVVLVLLFLLGMTAQPQVLQPSTNWTLTSYRDATGILIPVINAGDITARFGRDGNITGFSGCNQYVSAYIKNGKQIRFTYPLHTRYTCDDRGIMQQEETYYKNLASAVALGSGTSEITFLDNDGTALLIFHRA